MQAVTLLRRQTVLAITVNGLSHPESVNRQSSSNSRDHHLNNQKHCKSPDFIQKFASSIQRIEHNLSYSQRQLDENIRLILQHNHQNRQNPSIDVQLSRLSSNTNTTSSSATTTTTAATTRTTTTIDSCSINLILDSIQRKYGVKSGPSMGSGLSSGSGYLKSNLFYQPNLSTQQSHNSQQRKFQIEIPASFSSSQTLSIPTFDSIRPTESFLILTLANLFSSKLSKLFETPIGNTAAASAASAATSSASAATTDKNLKDYLLLLLNIVQLIRNGSETRQFDFSKNIQFPFQNATSSRDRSKSGSDSKVQNSLVAGSRSLDHQYRLELLKGNIYFYNVTYSLMKLNIRNISDLMAESLRQISAAQYWLDREADTAFQPAPVDCDILGPKPLLLSGPFCEKLLSGQLIQNWPTLVYYREASLLGNGAKSMAYLLGKQFGADFEMARSIGCNLAYLLSLIDDYYQLKHLQTCSLDPETLTEIATISTQPVGCLNFFLRLPVLLYFKENGQDIARSLISLSSNSDLEQNVRPTTEQLILDVLANIDQSNAMDKTLALIEHYANILQRLILGQSSATAAAPPAKLSLRKARNTGSSASTATISQNESIQQMLIELLQVCADFDNHRQSSSK